VVDGQEHLKGLPPSMRKQLTFQQGWGAEVDNDNRKRAFREKKAERFKQGQLAHGKLPLGYGYNGGKKGDHTVFIDEEQADVVRLIFRLYTAEGLSITHVRTAAIDGH
jgi:hypothetical protein